MKINGNDPTFPKEGNVQNGLTKREVFALSALQGCLVCLGVLDQAADEAVRQADALISALNANPPR